MIASATPFARRRTGRGSASRLARQHSSRRPSVNRTIRAAELAAPRCWRGVRASPTVEVWALWGRHADKKGLLDPGIRRGHDFRAAVRDLTHVVRRRLSGHHRFKPERCPYLEGRRGPFFGSSSVLALRGLQRQIQRHCPPDGDPICGRARGGPVCKLDRRWSARAGAIVLWGDGIRGRSDRLLDLQASRTMTTARHAYFARLFHYVLRHA